MPSYTYFRDTGKENQYQYIISRVRTGHGNPGKSWYLIISFSKPGKSWNLGVGHGKSWKIGTLSMSERHFKIQS